MLIARCLVTTSQHLGSGQGSQGLPTASRLDVWVRICCGDSRVAPQAVGELGFLLGLFCKRLFPVVVTAAPASVLGVRVRMSGGLAVCGAQGWELGHKLWDVGRQ